MLVCNYGLLMDKTDDFTNIHMILECATLLMTLQTLLCITIVVRLMMNEFTNLHLILQCVTFVVRLIMDEFTNLHLILQCVTFVVR